MEIKKAASEMRLPFLLLLYHKFLSGFICTKLCPIIPSKAQLTSKVSPTILVFYPTTI